MPAAFSGLTHHTLTSPHRAAQKQGGRSLCHFPRHRAQHKGAEGTSKMLISFSICNFNVCRFGFVPLCRSVPCQEGLLPFCLLTGSPPAHSKWPRTSRGGDTAR